MPAATARRMSRSVTIPTRSSPSITRSEPVCCSRIFCAAAWSVSSGWSVTAAAVMISEIFIRSLLAILDGDVGLFPRADVLRFGTDQPVVGELLPDVRGPARDPAGSEDGGHQVVGDAQVVVDACRVEVDVRIQALLV